MINPDIAIAAHRFSIAPMLDWTDRHARYFLRQLTQSSLLYTEMITTGALIHGDREYHLLYNPEEHPISLQLGGSDPYAMAECAKFAESAGYDEVNINVGCPSDRVQNGQFGACLIASPDIVADCVSRMRDAVEIPITVKMRTGVDDLDSYDHFSSFVNTVASSGCKTFVVHARKAWLKGLSPKENRTIPPLNYETVYRLKKELNDLTIIINGGIETMADCHQHLTQVDGVMLGRAAYQNPWILTEVDHTLFDQTPMQLDRADLIRSFFPYIEKQLSDDVFLKHMTRHLMGYFMGQPGARKWRQTLSEKAVKKNAGIEIIEEALTHIAFEQERVSDRQIESLNSINGAEYGRV